MRSWATIPPPAPARPLISASDISAPPPRWIAAAAWWAARRPEAPAPSAAGCLPCLAGLLPWEWERRRRRGLLGSVPCFTGTALLPLQVQTSA